MVGDEEAVHRQPHSRGARFAGGHREASARVCPEASARADLTSRPTTTSPTWRSQRNWRSGGPRWNVFVSGASSAASLPRWSARLSRIRRARGSSTERRRRGSYRIACCAPPEGRTRWTLSLLGERLIELKVFETVSKSSVQRTLKKTSSSPGESSASASPGENAPFVSAMEDVLDVYHLPYDEMRPVVCFDETSKNSSAMRARPSHPDPGPPRVSTTSTPARARRNLRGHQSVTGKALVQVTERRTSIDTARFFKRLSDEVYAAATTIVLVMDNLSTHSIACLYEAFPPAEARRIARRFEIHHTPRHGSCSTSPRLSLHHVHRVPRSARTQCSDLRALIDAWLRSRTSGKVRWRFRAEDARIKLHRLYPSLP